MAKSWQSPSGTPPRLWRHFSALKRYCASGEFSCGASRFGWPGFFQSGWLFEPKAAPDGLFAQFLRRCRGGRNTNVRHRTENQVYFVTAVTFGRDHPFRIMKRS